MFVCALKKNLIIKFKERRFLGESIHIISILFNLVIGDSSILSTDKLWAVCLLLISFDRNLS